MILNAPSGAKEYGLESHDRTRQAVAEQRLKRLKKSCAIMEMLIIVLRNI